jgi:hypothetical protein
MDRTTFWRSADAAAGQVSDSRRLAQLAPASAQTDVATDPHQLVARAIGILAEHGPKSGDTQANWNAWQGAVQQRAAPDLSLQRPILSDGTECPLPIRYFDVGCLVASFLTELDRAVELLEGTGLQAVPQEDGKGVVLLYCIEYRITDIGPYNEVGLTVLARAPGDPIPAIYVVNLPVTTELASRVGREIWGYNKFVAAIDVKSDGKNFSTILRDLDEVTIGAFQGSRGPSVPAPPSDILTFTMLNGRLIKTLIRVLTPFHASRGEGLVFKVGTSRHPMTNNLRIAGLDGASPVLVQYADPLQVLLFPGRPL